MTRDGIRAALPRYARDLALNLGTAPSASGAPGIPGAAA